MTYELAKKLKDGGFPQHVGDTKQMNSFHGGGNEHDGWTVIENGRWYISRDTEKVYIPSLSELIEACGTAFISLSAERKTSKRISLWQAKSMTGDGLSLDDWILVGGSTPEEAVANLWLALNKNS